MWIPDNLKEKWGLGWIIICLLFFSPQASKGYDTLGTTGQALQLFGCAVAIVLYFLLRNKVLKKVETTWVRSLISGVLAYGSVWLILFLLGKSFVSAQSSDNRKFFHLIDDETSKLTTYMQDFAKRNQQLSDAFIANPNNQQEIVRNLSTVEILTQLYYSKDSTLLATTKRLHAGLSKAFTSSEMFQKNFPLSPNDFQSVIDSGDSLAVEHQKVMNTLLEYQKALFRKDRNSDNFLQVYLSSNDALSLKEKSFALIYQRLFGQDVFAKIKEFEDKYYK
jgi:hypothetical protein